MDLNELSFSQITVTRVGRLEFQITIAVKKQHDGTFSFLQNEDFLFRLILLHRPTHRCNYFNAGKHHHQLL